MSLITGQTITWQELIRVQNRMSSVWKHRPGIDDPTNIPSYLEVWLYLYIGLLQAAYWLMHGNYSLKLCTKL